MAESKMVFHVETNGLDEAIEKANQLVEILQKALDIVNSLSSQKLD